MFGRRLTRNFYSRSALQVARKLLGMLLVHQENGVRLSGEIVETEAYLGAQDPASHAYRGRTKRNEVMFGPPGRLYVYFTYGNHHCANVVTGAKGEACAVLIRALKPLEGVETMQRRRKRKNFHELASGPGKLTQALGIDLRLNGESLFGPKIWIEKTKDGKRIQSMRSRRIGISQGVGLMYRFYVANSEFVSKRAPQLREGRRRRQVSS